MCALLVLCIIVMEIRIYLTGFWRYSCTVGFVYYCYGDKDIFNRILALCVHCWFCVLLLWR
jgi:hypothetical protein